MLSIGEEAAVIAARGRRVAKCDGGVSIAAMKSDRIVAVLSSHAVGDYASPSAVNSPS